MKENILMLLTLEEISNITKGLKIALDSVSQDETKGETKIDDKLENNIEDVLKKLLQVEAECSR